MLPNETSDIQFLFDQAVGFHQAGRLTEAESLYRRILILDPLHADALHLLGVTAYQAGQNDVAADLIERAIGINGQAAAYHSNRGNALKGLGRIEEALASYEAALRIDPNHADAHYNRGASLSDLGRLEEALTAYEATLRRRPDHFKAQSSCGNALKALNRLDEALTAYDVTLRIRPDYAIAHNNRGNVLKDLGRYEEALAAFESALRFKPDYVSAHNNHGGLLKDLGRCAEALAAYDAALRIAPADADAHYGRGAVLADLARFEEALASYDTAVRHKPNYVQAYNNRGNVLTDLARFDEALASYDAALQIDPEYVEAHVNRGNLLRDLGRLEEALASYNAALRIKPDYADAHNNLIYCMHYRSDMAGEGIRAAAASFGAVFPAAPEVFLNTRDAGRRLRVGLVSGDFGRHPVGYFLLPFLANRSRLDTEVFCYATYPRNDGMTANLRAGADHWRSLVGMSDKAADAQIRTDAIDILIDLSGHTAHNRLALFARRPAPVQATWLGYWGTTGLAVMDYILSDAATIPSGKENFYCEQVLRLPNGRFCYAPPSYAPEPAPPPCLRDGVVTFGSFNHLGKVGAEVIALWAAVLHAVPGSRLLLKWRSLANTGVRRRLSDSFAAQGITQDRLLLRAASPHPQMLAEYGDMDVALDPFPFSGGLTTCEALWMGVPVVTLPGPVGPSRQTLGFLGMLGLEDWTAADADHYISIASGLAADHERLGVLRQKLRPRIAASPLCDGSGFARNIEGALRTMWRNWCAHPDSVL